MALIKCPECNSEISSKAISCPKCGFPLEKKTLLNCPECKSEITSKMTTCKECGHPLKKETNGKVQVLLEHSVLSPTLMATTPNVDINNKRHSIPWGSHSFDLPPGDYVVTISYPWLLRSECSKQTIGFYLGPGELVKVSYRVGGSLILNGLDVFGTISVENTSKTKTDKSKATKNGLDNLCQICNKTPVSVGYQIQGKPVCWSCYENSL